MAKKLADNRKILLCPTSMSGASFEMSTQVYAMLEQFGRRAVICPMFEDVTAAASVPRGINVADLAGELSEAELIITFSGDGTILRAARMAADTGTPILGVNMGGKGFIAELETDDIGLLANVVTGKYKLEQRMMLDVHIMRDGEPVGSDFALNDIVVKGDNKVINLTLYGDGQRITGFSGDGVVIATPTGSTAYSMAAGGPIVEPLAHNIIITPICAHMLQEKSFVLVSDRNVTAQVGLRKHTPAYMSVDGGDHVAVYDGDTISVRKSEKSTRLIRLTDRSFYEKVSKKLGEQQ